MTYNFETKCLPHEQEELVVERIALQHCMLQAWALLALDDLLNLAVTTDRMSALYKHNIEGVSNFNLAKIESKKVGTVRATQIKAMDRLIAIALQQVGVVQIGRKYSDAEILRIKTNLITTQSGQLIDLREWSRALREFREQFSNFASQIFTHRQLNFLLELSQIKPVEAFYQRLTKNHESSVKLVAFHKQCCDEFKVIDLEKIMQLVILERFSEVVEIFSGIRDRALVNVFSVE